MDNTYKFELYIMGNTLFSKKAVSNLDAVCRKKLGNEFELEIIDLEENIELAENMHIFATPTLIRIQPEPVLRIIGDFSDFDFMVQQLGL